MLGTIRASTVHCPSNTSSTRKSGGRRLRVTRTEILYRSTIAGLGGRSEQGRCDGDRSCSVLREERRDAQEARRENRHARGAGASAVRPSVRCARRCCGRVRSCGCAARQTRRCGHGASQACRFARSSTRTARSSAGSNPNCQRGRCKSATRTKDGRGRRIWERGEARRRLPSWRQRAKIPQALTSPHRGLSAYPAPRP